MRSVSKLHIHYTVKLLKKWIISKTEYQYLLNRVFSSKMKCLILLKVRSKVILKVCRKYRLIRFRDSETTETVINWQKKSINLQKKMLKDLRRVWVTSEGNVCLIRCGTKLLKGSSWICTLQMLLFRVWR